jgi:hypothetical protein
LAGANSGILAGKNGQQRLPQLLAFAQGFFSGDKHSNGGFMLTKLSWISGVVILLLILSFQATAQDDDSVVSLLSDELDISSSKARGGAGAIFANAKDNLDDDDFDRIAEGIPDMNSLLDAAPEVDRDSGMGRFGDVLNDFDSSMGGACQPGRQL